MIRMIKKVTPLLLVALLVVTTAAQASSTYRNAWNAAYPNACATLKTAVSNCTLCHTSVPNLNPYGAALIGHSATIAASTDNLDSDGDGKTNLVEIDHCTLPGNPLSKPVPNDSQAWGALKGSYR
jgi:hypothetical protein